MQKKINPSTPTRKTTLNHHTPISQFMPSIQRIGYAFCIGTAVSVYRDLGVVATVGAGIATALISIGTETLFHHYKTYTFNARELKLSPQQNKHEIIIDTDSPSPSICNAVPDFQNFVLPENCVVKPFNLTFSRFDLLQKISISEQILSQLANLHSTSLFLEDFSMTDIFVTIDLATDSISAVNLAGDQRHTKDTHKKKQNKLDVASLIICWLLNESISENLSLDNIKNRLLKKLHRGFNYNGIHHTPGLKEKRIQKTNTFFSTTLPNWLEYSH